jgi:hypothetical protein
MDDMDTIEAILVKTERPINKYYVNGGENPGWCLRLESDDAQRELVLTFDEYGRLNKIL